MSAFHRFDRHWEPLQKAKRQRTLEQATYADGLVRSDRKRRFEELSAYEDQLALRTAAAASSAHGYKSPFFELQSKRYRWDKPQEDFLVLSSLCLSTYAREFRREAFPDAKRARLSSVATTSAPVLSLGLDHLASMSFKNKM